ncbi:PREDICTED: octopamine receptor-like [Amphimedon queenslandica]|uniref:G-protein coupled receptors family 1 profile domain-containing protein n=1 Tax=Amphimedon queenslandica TaxID=400682 RepID=A0A1X7VLM2_AMPQE|nr:PREDICTED: octopamine receptor-like [Amphimedon queenslandica]|eukprot:XP_011409750.2 PREDICTED: octopamine receptor-like [Amphimedon queenslandica]
MWSSCLQTEACIISQAKATQLTVNLTPSTLYRMEEEYIENNNFTLSEDINGPLLAAVIGVEMVAGLIANIFVLTLSCFHCETYKKPSTIFLTNMLVANLIIIVVVMPFSIATCVSGEWIFGSTVSSKLASCEAMGTLFGWSTLIATESLVLLSFDRFFFIVKAGKYNEHMTVKKALIIVAASWILAAILVSPPQYGFGGFVFANSYGLCGPNFRSVGFSVYGFFIIGSLIISIVVTSLWTYCYTKKFIKEMNSRMLRESVYFSQHTKLVGIFGTLIIVHIFCYSLFLSVSVVRPFVAIPRQLWATTLVFLLLITILSPLVQSYFRSETRNFIQNLLLKIRLSKSHPTLPTRMTVTSLIKLKAPSQTLSE